MRDTFRTVDPEIQLNRLREEKDELERELSVLRAEQKAHKCPKRFVFSNPFKRTGVQLESLYEINKRRMDHDWNRRTLISRAFPIMMGMLVIGFVAFFSYVIYDNYAHGLRSGIVTNLHHKAAWTEMTVDTDANGHSSVHTTFHPERWWGIVCDEGRCEEANFSENRWHGIHEGQRLCLRDCRGLASNE